MTAARYLLGDTRDVTATLPDASVDLVLTSPPFLALRSYLPADHPDKAREIGSEATPAEFLDVLLALTAEWGRVLAPHGSIAIELGDTYSGSGGAGGDYTDTGLRAGQEKFAGSAIQHRRTAQRNRQISTQGRRSRAQDEADGVLAPRSRPGPEGRDQVAGWPLDKSLCLIPELYRIALAYGINPLTGAESPAGRWRVRNVVRWHRPNPPVGALGDKFRPGTSDLVIATRSRTRYFDLDAVRTPYSENSHARTSTAVTAQARTAKTSPDGNRDTLADRNNDGAGAPPLDTWIIPTHPYKGAHYATWPPELCVKPIKSMVPERVCTTCGEPSRRITESEQVETGRSSNGSKPRDRDESFAGTTYETRTVSVATTLGWTDCGHDTWRRGIVLDPFAGSGTTLAVATGLGRDAVGIDIDERNADLARERVGMFLTVEDTREQVA